MTPTSTLPATVRELASHGPTVRLELAVEGGGPVVLTLVLPGGAGRALPHIHALHGHVDGCAGRSDVHIDLLLRCCRVLGGDARRVIVRATGEPAFWLEVEGGDGDVRHLDVGVLDAVVLLASRRLPVGVEVRRAPVEGDWDVALRRLLDEG